MSQNKSEIEFESKTISDNEVSECISEKVDDGVPQEQAVAICLSEAEEGSAEPVNRQVTVEPRQKKDVLTQTILVPDQLLYREESTAKLVGEMLGIDGCHTHDLGGTTYFMPGETHEQFFEVVGEPGVEDLIEQNREMQDEEDEEDEETMSLENPQFAVGDFVRWDFATGSAEGEIIDRKTDVGDSMSAGGNTFTIEEGDGPLYKIQEFDDEVEEFTNNVVKFEDALRTVQRPDEAPQTAPRNRSNKTRENMELKTHNFTVKGKDMEIVREKEDDTMIRVPIQAVSEDRDGDVITDKGQDSIVQQLETGTVPLMPNHGVGNNEAMYDFRDIMGQFVDGERMEDATVGVARLREGNEMAEELLDLHKQDMPVGFSVGFIPTDTEEGKDVEGMRINDLDLMEVSPVGVPSNSDAVPQAMAGAVSMAKRQGMKEQQIKNAVEQAFEQAVTPETKAEGDVEALDLAEFTASHFEGVDSGDVMQGVDADQYIGQVDLREIASLVADRVDMDQGNVLEAMEQLADMEAESYGEDEEDDEEEMNTVPDKNTASQTIKQVDAQKQEQGENGKSKENREDEDFNPFVKTDDARI